MENEEIQSIIFETRAELEREIEEINKQCINGDEFDILVKRVEELQNENQRLKDDMKRLKIRDEANSKAIHEQFGFYKDLLKRVEDIEKYGIPDIT